MAIRLRALSWNLHAVPGAPSVDERLSASAREIDTHAPDVILLQEVWRRDHVERLEAALAPEYRVVRLPDEGWLLRPSGLLCLVRRDGPWRIEESDFTPFDASAPLWKLWEGDGLGRKGVHRVSLQQGPVRLHLLNTHLQAEYDDHYSYQEIRSRQLAQLAAIAEGLQAAEPASLVLAAGDLNTDRFARAAQSAAAARRETALYRGLLEEWRDLSEAACTTEPCATHFREANERGGWIDYVLWRRSPHWQITLLGARQLRNERRDVPYSDHEGLLIELRAEPTATPSALPLAVALIARDSRVDRRTLFASGLLAGGGAALGLAGFFRARE